MVLESRIAKDLEKLILRTNFNPESTLNKLNFYVKLERITVEEYNYLVEIMEKRVAEMTEKELIKK